MFLDVWGRPALAALLNISDKHLCAVLYGLREREQYREFEIEKKGGGCRRILAPPANLARIQTRLLRVLEVSFEPRSCVQGFVRGRSIVSNAQIHCGKRFVLNVDLRDFFPTIHIGRVIGAFRKEPFCLSCSVATVIGQIACDGDGLLPQGAPTSPIIANIVCRALDTALQRIAQSHCCAYSRYADDISISTSNSTFPEELATTDDDGNTSLGDLLDTTIRRHGFEINVRKVWMRTHRERQEVTGLTVNEFPNLTRRYVREMRAILHNWEKLGYEAAAAQFAEHYLPTKNSLLEDGETFRRYVHGRLAFLSMVRGKHDPVYRRLRARLHFIDSEKAPPPIKVGHIGPTPLRGNRGSRFGWERIMDHCRQSVCFLQVDKSRSGQFASNTFGTAFCFKRDLLATAGHNLQDANVRVDMPFVEPVAPRATKHRNVVGGVDCGMIMLPRPLSQRLPPLSTQERIPEVGEEVAAIGFPYVPHRHTALVMHVGTVSALVRSYQNELFIQVSFHTGGGLSGSPLVDRRGYVLGIMVESVFHKPEDIEVPAVQYGQAIPIGYLHYLSSDPWIGLADNEGGGEDSENGEASAVGSKAAESS